MTFPEAEREPAARRVPLTVRRAGEIFPAAVWLPVTPAPPKAVVLVGHGGGMHKNSWFVTRLAGHLAENLGYAAVAIDAPYHGERIPAEEKGLSVIERRERMGLAAWRERNSRATAQAVADWHAAIDAVLALDEVPDVPVGYYGVSMGTRFGIPLVAAESRITAAVFGLFSHPAGHPEVAFARAARRVTVPVLFLMQWDDELFPRDDALALFDLLGPAAKTLHANPGGHLKIPLAEVNQGARFLSRHLTPEAPPRATKR